MTGFKFLGELILYWWDVILITGSFVDGEQQGIHDTSALIIHELIITLVYGLYPYYRVYFFHVTIKLLKDVMPGLTCPGKGANTFQTVFIGRYKVYKAV